MRRRAPSSSTPVSKINTAQGPLFVLKYESKRVIVTRPSTYRQYFPDIPQGHNVTFHTKDLEVCEGKYAEVPEYSWDNVVGHLKSLTILTSPPENAVMKSEVVNLKLVALTGKSSIATLNRFIPIKYALPNLPDALMLVSPDLKFPDDYRFLHQATQLDLDWTLHEYGMQDGDVIHIIARLHGKKPVIYLFTPTEMDASVKLSLVPQWDFSVVYPVVPIKRDTAGSGEHLEWSVRATPGGNLTELNTGLDVTYLFWEAHTNPKVLCSPPPSPRLGNDGKVIEEFHPSFASLSNEDSVLLPVPGLTPYLDKALKALGLHTEARTSFITFWLPTFLKHKQVALRFVSQSAYEKAAPLEVTPSPNVTTRIFMLFKGVRDEEAGAWSRAAKRAQDDVRWWVDVVGVDVLRTLDETLFRVVEWGGMELDGVTV